jgi:putative nucleotidyltransferase with HDIG domain
MQTLVVYSERGCASAEVLATTRQLFTVQQRKLDTILRCCPGPLSLIEIDLRHSSRSLVLSGWLANKPPRAKVVVVLTNSHPECISKARHLGADKVLVRPVEASDLLRSLSDEPEPCPPGVHDAATSLQAMFSSVRSGKPVRIEEISSAADSAAQQLKSSGLSEWLDEVRKHHNRTFQHCLLVTGVAVAFCQHLGFSHSDEKRVSFAAMLHDVGKAKVPLNILEKPGSLDEQEWAMMRQHPRLGADALLESNVSADVLDVVLHHHEYLDGTGYPDGLRGAQIKDFVRLMTIADVFGALLERRSYKPPLDAVLLEMGPKLDEDMVREFQALI